MAGRKTKKDESILGILSSEVDNMTAKKAKKKVETTPNRIIVSDTDSGCVVAVYDGIPECIANMNNTYESKFFAKNIENCLYNLCNSYNGFSFRYENPAKVNNPYAKMRIHFISAKTGYIMKTGSLYEMAKEAGVTPIYLVTKAKTNAEKTPTLLKRKPYIAIIATKNYAEDCKNAILVWAKYLEKSTKMFPTIMDSRGKVLASFYNVGEACMAMGNVVDPTKVVCSNIQSACYNEKAYLGYVWAFKTGATYLKYRYDDESTTSLAPSEAGLADTVSAFSVSKAVRDVAMTYAKKG